MMAALKNPFPGQLYNNIINLYAIHLRDQLFAVKQNICYSKDTYSYLKELTGFSLINFNIRDKIVTIAMTTTTAKGTQNNHEPRSI